MFALLALPSLCLADRLVYSRGESLFLAELNGAAPRQIGGVAVTETRWAVSRDGRRVVWLKIAKGAAEASLAKPVAVFLGDTAGRRQKKLTSTDGLKDTSGQRVSQVGPTREGGGVTPLKEWSVASVGFSSDGRTLYLGLSHTEGESAVATVALDAFTGAAVVDAEGNWKVLAPIAQADARDSLLAGAGTASASALSGPDAVYLPLTLVNFEDESVSPLPPTASLGGKRPPYGLALWPALSPDKKRIAFGSLPAGLWLSDAAGKFVKRLIPTEAARPRFSLDGKTLFFLAPRPTTGDKQSFDLFRLDPDSPAAPPTRHLDDIDWFDIIPD
jgi:hypothetical protein